MDVNEYRKRGKEMVDYVANYLENIRERRVFPDVKPGYMKTMLPDSAPLDGENWQNIIDDVERVIMPGITHWQSPHMHAYFPALNSFPSLLGDMLADAINCLGFTWASSPACTELETIVMNWLGKMIGLPDEFLYSSTNSGGGGGVIQTTASESTLICLLAGRTQAIRRFHESTPGFQDAEINARLVAYCSDQAHSSVEKAALIGLVRMRYIESDEKLSLRGKPLRDAIDEDIKAGLVPFWVCATLGTTGACAFDHLEEVGFVCQEYKLWLHVDAAYAGSAFLCPEYRIWLKGIEKCDSIAFNPSKWLMVHFDCTAMWVKNSTALHRTFNVEPLYLQHENSGLAIDYMHWQIPLSKRFRSLKLWFVIRSYGIKGLQKHIRESVRLAQKFEALVLADVRFEIPAQRHLGLVVFRLKGENELTEKLLKRLNHRGNLHCVPSSLKGKYVIRFTVTSTHTTNDDILKDWAEIRNVASEVINELNVKTNERARVPLKEIREKNDAFGSSLLLANCPMSPKVVNGSFAAIFDADEFLAQAFSGIRTANQDSPAMRRRVRGILMSGKQFSLDSRMDLVVQGIGTSKSNGVEKSRAIEEDCEDNGEACENSRITATIRETNQLLPIKAYKFLQPLQTPNTKPRCNHKIKLTKKRSLSMDEMVWNYDKLKLNRIFNEDSVDCCYTDHTIFNTNLHFIQNKSFYEMALQSVSDASSSLFNASNVYSSPNAQLNSINEELLEEQENEKMLVEFNPDHRQSEPNICYSFLNYGFEMNNHIANQKFSVPELIINLDNISERKKWLKKDKPFDDYYSIDKELEAALHSPLTANIFPEYEKADSGDDDDDYNEGTIYENIKYCRKCGHKSLKFQ